MNTINLLKAIQLETETQLHSLVIESVVIKKESNAFFFQLSIDKALPVNIYLLFKTHLHEHFIYQADFSLSVLDPSSYEGVVLDYASLLVEDLSDVLPMLKTVSFTYSDGLVLNLINDIHHDFLKTQLPVIEQQWSSYGLDMPIHLKIVESKEYEEVLQQLQDDPAIQVSKRPEPSYQEKPKPTFKRGLANATFYALGDIQYDMRNVVVEAFVFKEDRMETKSGKVIQTFYLTDFGDSMMAKRFLEKGDERLDELNGTTKWIKAYGEVRFDTFAREQVLMIQNIEVIDSKLKPRLDTASEKRVELHVHTKMSTMDGVSTIEQYVAKAAEWGHKAIAVTDHCGVQSFPDAQYAAKKHGLEKIIYGVEMNMIDTNQRIYKGDLDIDLQSANYVVFDFETTGLSCFYDDIIEFGAVKIKGGSIVDRKQLFIKPSRPLSRFTTQLTGITEDMVQGGLSLEEAMIEIRDFLEDCVLVAHNGFFDLGFLNAAYQKVFQQTCNNPLIDTLPLSHVLHLELRYHRLGTICRHYKIAYDDYIAHRADYDAEVLQSVFMNMLHELNERKVTHTSMLNDLFQKPSYGKIFSSHVNVIAKNQKGLKDLFKLVSYSNTDYFYQQPKIPKSLLVELREDLLISAGCLNSDVFEAALNKSDEDLAKAISFYDFVEIQPLEQYLFLVDLQKVSSKEHLIEVMKRLIHACDQQGVMVVASGDVHYLDPKDKVFRDVYIVSPGIGGAIHPLFDRKGRIKENPNQHFRSTSEMLTCFDYLDDQKTYELVVTNSNLICDMIEPVTPLKKDLYTPKIDGADEKLTKMCYDNAKKIYGDPIPEYVKERLERELDSIIKHGFGVIYYISHQLVKKSLEDGYLVGSRGSVGSSLVATLSEITEVNPLKPHYVCPKCQHSEFFDDGRVASGYDLPDANCPKCQTKMHGDGQDIPFETFLGFEGDKVPDIDLNFSGEYQSRAHQYTKVLFGEDKVFRAGTISTVAEKTAFGYAKGYAESIGKQDSIRNAELTRLASGCEGVKRTSGQHPGGIIVIPNDMDVYDFTPIQFPADDVNSEWKTTHFDFHAIHDNILKLDILGHVDPTAIRMLQDLTGVDPKTIPTNDAKVMSLFNSNKVLNANLDYLSKSGAMGIPEFGTAIARATLDETQPSTFNELVILSGLSHGTGVWAGNAQDLIRSGQRTLKEVIGCRDDIMVYLIHKGMKPKLAFDIMESVRKGKGLKEEWMDQMREANVPDWYIDSCLKIQYMFPKAHAVAYVLMAVRVAWFKLYYPREYYATYFTTRCSTYDIETMIEGKDAVSEKMLDIQDRMMKRLEVTSKEKELIAVFEMALEMFERGYYFANIDLIESDASRFSLSKHDAQAIYPPFTSLDGLGENVALSIVEARKDGAFISKEDLMKRTQINQTTLKKLDLMKVTNALQEQNQLSLF